MHRILELMQKFNLLRLELWKAVKAIWIAWRHLSTSAPVAAYAMLVAAIISSAIAPLTLLVYQELVSAIADHTPSAIHIWVYVLFLAVDEGFLKGLILGGWDLWLQEKTYQRFRMILIRHFSFVLDADSARVLRGEFEDIRDDIQRSYWSMSNNFYNCVGYAGQVVGFFWLLQSLPPALIALILGRAGLSAIVSMRFGWGRYRKARAKDPERKRLFSGYRAAESSEFHDELHHRRAGTSHFLDGLEASGRNFLENLKEISQGRSVWKGLSALLGAGTTGAICWYVAQSRINVGLFLRLTSAASLFSSNLALLTGDVGTLASGAQTALRIHEFTQYKTSTGSEVAATPDRSATIKLEELTVKFPTEKGSVKALDQVSLTITSGEKIGLIGPNASGKTTLINIIQGLHRYYIVEGRLLVQGIDVRSWSLPDLNDRISVCRQGPTILPISTAQNVTFGVNEDPELVRQVAQLIGFEWELNEIGLNTLMREDAGGRPVSGGQAQKITNLRALCHYFANPDVFMLIGDEATSAVYSADSDRIFDAYLGLKGTVILVTHSPYLARRIGLDPRGRIISMEKGRVVEDGTHAELIATRGTYYELLKMQGLLQPEER